MFWPWLQCFCNTSKITRTHFAITCWNVVGLHKCFDTIFLFVTPALDVSATNFEQLWYTRQVVTRYYSHKGLCVQPPHHRAVQLDVGLAACSTIQYIFTTTETLSEISHHFQSKAMDLEDMTVEELKINRNSPFCLIQVPTEQWHRPDSGATPDQPGFLCFGSGSKHQQQLHINQLCRTEQHHQQQHIGGWYQQLQPVWRP